MIRVMGGGGGSVFLRHNYEANVWVVSYCNLCIIYFVFMHNLFRIYFVIVHVFLRICHQWEHCGVVVCALDL